MLKRIVLTALFGLAMLGCGGGDEGDNCEVESDCGSGLLCAQIAVCVTAPCPGVCGYPCDTDADCSEGQCGDSAGGQRVCHNSRTEGR